MFCTDSGGAFSTPYSLFSLPLDSNVVGLGPDVKTGPNGEVFVCWARELTTSNYAHGFYFCESNNGGGNFNAVPPKLAIQFSGSDEAGLDVGDGNFNEIRLTSWPSMAVDKSCGPNNGRIYVTFNDVVSGNFVIQVTHLDPPYTGGWSTPITASIPDPFNTSRSFFPRIAVDDVTGMVCIDYYNFPLNSGGAGIFTSTNTYLAYSSNGGNSYSNIEVSSTAINVEPISTLWPTHYLPPLVPYMGDYIGITAHNGIAYPAWMSPYQVYVAKVSIDTVKINTNTTWNSNETVQTDVEVTSPNTLTIASGVTISIIKGKSIIVDTGATLIVDGTLTNACSGLWSGIYVEGNATQAQTSTHQGTVTLNPGSKIEYALNGITTIKNTSSGWDWTHTGGIIKANEAHFYNNWRDIQFLYYSKPNKSTFTNCTFTVDTNYYNNYFTNYGLASRVTMYQVHGVTFLSDTFANNIPVATLSNVYRRSDGIFSIDASYNVNNCTCFSSYPPGGCCGYPNIFTGFGYGICASNTNPSYNIDITGNTFTNNYGDILILNVNNMVITSNTCSKTANIGTGYARPPYNIYLDQCSGYNVSGNSLSNTNYTNSYGTIVNNSGPTNNLINNNDFSGIYVQSQSQGINGQVSAGVVTSPFHIPYIYYSGLQYHCNNYNSTVSNGADISVAGTISNPALIDPRQGSRINLTTTANNTFNSGSCNSPDFRLNIYAYSSLPLPWTIFYATAGSGPSPYCESNSTVDTITLSGTGNCTPTYTVSVLSGSILAENGVNYHSTLRAQKQAFHFSEDSLDGVLAKGNTSGLLTVIETGLSATVILDSCLNAGPYLSDSVLKTAIRAGLPLETLANIIIPNTPLDSSVVSTLNGIGLPDTLATRLNTYQVDSILSPRSILFTRINGYQGLMDYTDNALITALETDTTIHNEVFDSAEAVLKSDSLTLPRLAQLASLQWAAGESTSATVTLDTLHRRDKDSIYARFYQLLPVLMTLSSSTTGYSSLHGNTADSTLLEHIAMDTLTPGYANARALLGFVYNQTFDEPIIPLSGSHSGHRFKKNNNLLIKSKDSLDESQLATLHSRFNLYPNPANSSLTIAYSLNSSAQEVNLTLYDVVGNKAANWSLPSGVSSYSMVTENISSLEAGMYFYTIFEDNKAVQRGKLVIER